MSLQRVSKRTRSTKMKQQQQQQKTAASVATAKKKKKLAMSKALEDSISETISFVIKGKLTPIKSTFVNKRAKIVKKDLTKKLLKKLPKKLEKRDKSSMELDNEVNNVKEEKKEQKPKKVNNNNNAKKEETDVKCEEGEMRTTKTKKQQSGGQQRCVKKEANVQIGESKKEEKGAKKDKSMQKMQEKRCNIKVQQKPQQQQQKPREKKYQPKAKKVINKSIKVCVKTGRNQANNNKNKQQPTLTSKRKTIENLMKQANKDLKEPIVNSVQSKTSNNAAKEEKDSKPKSSPIDTGNKEIKRGKINNNPKKKKLPVAANNKVNRIKNELIKCKPRKRIAADRKETRDMKSVSETPKKTAISDKIKTEDAALSTGDDTSDELTLDLLRRQTIKTETDEKPSSDETTKSSAAVNNKRIKVEQESDAERKAKKCKVTADAAKKKKKNVTRPKMVLMKKRIVSAAGKDRDKKADRSRKMKLFSFWNGPKRHRVASLNALAKVHCLYENESRANLLDNLTTTSSSTRTTSSNSNSSKTDDKTTNGKSEEEEDEDEDEKPEVAPMRTLRSQPGLRAIGKHWDMHDSTSSSSEESSENEGNDDDDDRKRKSTDEKPKERGKKPVKRRRNRTELIMDLKDMVVRKRMASLNASAILAASYCVEKRSLKSPTIDDETTTDTDDSDDTYVEESERKSKPTGDRKNGDDDDDEEDDEEEEDDSGAEKEDDRKVFEVCATPNKKVAVILNQDTDVTITGVYVNSTTRSTHHEGYCSIAGMQYRISATSHTQTAATAVATETILQSSSSQENSNSDSTPSKSYTPLDALSSMQPPGGTAGTTPHGVTIGPPHHHLGPPHHIGAHGSQLSPMGRRCNASAFTAPAGPYAAAPGHHHPSTMTSNEPGYIHGYYQPAGPLISVPHGHTQQQQPLGKSAPLSEPSPSTPPPTHQPPPPSSVGDSSDSEVIITSITTAKEATPPQQQQQPIPPPPPQSYRFGQFPPTHGGYPYGYPQYYPAPPPGPGFVHHDLCYPPNPYLHHKTYPPTYRRYITPLAGSQYFSPNQELYNAPPTAANPPNQQFITTNLQQVVTASPSTANVTSYQSSPSGPPPTLIETYPPPPTLVETYAPAAHYYPPGYGPPPPPPSCYTHSPSSRTLPYINPTYQSCPCPMQSCPKNGLTGPLTGDSKRSSITSIAKESFPLPPVALALPLEPASATGPPSPARGSAGMPPPPSPAGATYQPPPSTPKQETLELADLKPAEKKRQARVGKAMVRNTIASHNNHHSATMLLMVGQTNNNNEPKVKREAESPKEIEHKKEAVSEVELKIKADDAVHETALETYKSCVISDDFAKKSIDETIVQHVSCLKMEDKKETVPLVVPETIEKGEETEEMQKNDEKEKEEDVLRQPCVKTVAENVKVKNMKRKHSIAAGDVTNKAETDLECPSSAKKQLLQKSPSTAAAAVATTTGPTCANGSYKDLIKKSTTSIKINNGKKKLVEARNPRTRAKMARLKRSAAAKRKMSAAKDDTCINNNKRLKTSKPLIDSNLHNSKVNAKENKDKYVDSDLIENKEPIKKNNCRKNGVNTKKTLSKKTAPAVLDNLIAKNIDRTIDSVVGECVTRTAPCNKTSDPSALITKTQEKCKIKQDVKKESVSNNNNNANNNKKSTNFNKTIAVKSSTSSSSSTSVKSDNARKVGANKRKSKTSTETVLAPAVVPKVPRKSLLPKWSNGWAWEGEPYEAKVFLNSDEATTVRKCYPAMRHEEGDVIEPRDCVLLKAGARKNELPFVAKIAALWENPEDGEMMMSLLWYYRPEHTDQGRLETDQPDEVFASRHKDSNSVACIEDKCYVLTYNEYCRYRKNLKRIDEGIEDATSIVPENEPYPREHRQPPLSVQVSPDMVFFCRRVYDFRQKRMFKNPT